MLPFARVRRPLSGCPTRRSLLTIGAIAGCGAAWSHFSPTALSDDTLQPPSRIPVKSSRAFGLLIGSLLGDALGGPIEFSEAPELQQSLCKARNWPDTKRLDANVLKELSSSLPLLSYKSLRPETAPYGPWVSEAPAGTLTDDSRHKIILQRAVRDALQSSAPLDAKRLAAAFLRFQCRTDEPDSAAVQKLNEDGLREYRYAANWLLGSRDLADARPLERLWAGVNNCSGQMLLLPLAIAYAGAPERAYHAAYALDFIDTPTARDMAASLVAGLAAALDGALDSSEPRARYERLEQALRRTDPFGYADVPFAGRQLTRWLDKADELVERSDGRPKTLYHLLETEGEPRFWWDAHFTLLVPLCILKLCDFDPIASMHLTLDFGHDTDSYAQVLGAIVGAVHGPTIFDTFMQESVLDRLDADYGEDLADWVVELTDTRFRVQPLIAKE